MSWLSLLAEQGGVLDGAMKGALRGAIIGGIAGGLVGLVMFVKRRMQKDGNENSDDDKPSSANKK